MARAKHGRDGDALVELSDLDPDSGVVPGVPLLELVEFLRSEDLGVGIIELPDQPLDGHVPDRGVGYG